MHPQKWQAAMAYAIATRDTAEVTGLILKDPQQRFGFNFDKYMVNVDADDIGIAYLKPLAVIGIRLEAGKIPNEDTLFKLLKGIQERTSWKLGAAASRRRNPLIDRRVRRSTGQHGEPLYFFTSAKFDFDQRPHDSSSPVEQLEAREQIQALLRELDTLPQLPMAVLREVRRFELEHKTRFGAFQAVALLADLDDEGDVMAIRTPELEMPDPETPTRLKPAKSIVRQIRNLYQEALEYLGEAS
jgi:hypothetical protein